MRWTIAYSKIKKRNLVLIDNATYQRETLSERPIRQPLVLSSIMLSAYMEYMVWVGRSNRFVLNVTSKLYIISTTCTNHKVPLFLDTGYNHF